MKRSLLSPVALAAIVLFVAPSALATPNFPGAIQRDLGLNAAPQCLLCHNNPAGGTGTVTTPFGVKMRARGLVPDNESSLATALTALEAEQSDVDGDRVGDIQELKVGSDPNNAPGANEEEAASTGCGAVISSKRTLPDAPVVLSGTLLAIGAILFRRRRPRSED